MLLARLTKGGACRPVTSTLPYLSPSLQQQYPTVDCIYFVPKSETAGGKRFHSCQRITNSLSYFNPGETCVILMIQQAAWEKEKVRSHRQSTRI